MIAIVESKNEGFTYEMINTETKEVIKRYKTLNVNTKKEIDSYLKSNNPSIEKEISDLKQSIAELSIFLAGGI